ncbi:MAG TPA: thiamine pyrophosphate-binding protein [Burkholderiales bacterium]|nr:thiamine pyrophosphate-binding protein [Burkholderiales bacterium]
MPKMTGNRYFAEAMRGYGVSHLFYVNSIIGNAMKEMESVGVKRVVAHGEKAAAYMADAYARASKTPGVCLAQDIGSTNLLAGLRDPHMASSPVIAITGGQNDLPRYRHAYQNAEDFASWAAVTKANYSVDAVERFPDLLRQAFRVATSGTPGPVHLELRGNAGQMLDKEGDFDLTWEERHKKFPAFRPAAEPEAVKAAIAALKRAAKPIIVAGGGAVASGAGAEIIKLAETLSIPIATSLHAKAIVPDQHPLNVGVPGSYSRWCANKAVQAADLVFFIGSHSGGQVTNGWQIPKLGTPTIQLDINPEELGRNYPNIVSLCGDAKVVVGQLVDAAGNEPARRAEWLEQARSYVADYWAESEPLRTSEAVPMRPERICKELEAWLPDDATVVVDTFHAAMWTAQMIKMKAGQSYLRCGGSLGWGFPASIGAKAAMPGKPVVAFVGDAGFYYHMAELETAARNKLNVVVVVNTNYSGGVLENVAFDPSVNFAKVADSMGCVGFRVEKPADIRGALDKALAAGKPALVEIVSDRDARAQRGWVPASISGE